MKYSVVYTFIAMQMVGIATGSAQSKVASATDERVHDARIAQRVLARRVTVLLVGVSLETAIRKTAASAAVDIQYQSELLDRIHAPVTLRVDGAPLGQVFSHLLAGTGLQVVVVNDGEIAVTAVPTGRSASGVIVGRVIDAATRRPIAEATVVLDRSGRGVQTDPNGTFRLADVAPGGHSLTVRRIGYGRVIQDVRVADHETTQFEIALSASASTLDQVVVTGTVAPTELKAVPNAITVVTAKDIEQRGITKIDQLFRGDIPGVFAQNQGSSPNALLDEVTMFSRGATALSASAGATSINNDLTFTNPIKTYVDGVELADARYLSQIDPKSIERIEILTGPQASTIYGSNALNGVMQIFTKRGISNTPQFTLTLLNGWVENNFSRALTPQHDYSGQLNGIEGRFSYNAGGSWNYMGPWTPAKQTARVSGFGGTHLEFSTPLGHGVADVTLRRTNTQNRQRGSVQQTATGYRESGWYSATNAVGLSVPTKATLEGQTLGMTVQYAPVEQWSHELSIGSDAEDTETRATARGYQFLADTTLSLLQTHNSRRSLRYATTLRVPLTGLSYATLTAGADAWQNLFSTLSASSQALTGSLTSVNSLTRQPGHNTGGFLQTQIGAYDRVFLTYGIRAEWNPDFGGNAQPNYAPRYGIAYTQEFGPLTAKLRASHGRSTRPPVPSRKVAVAVTALQPLWVQDYGNFDFYEANLGLAPEHEQGGEGGVELYWGAHGSLVVTHYNQTVNELIASAIVDSVRSILPHPTSGSTTNLDTDNYGYRYQYEYLNIGSIHNQGWELQGSVNTGPFTTHGTYSWTKSRSGGVNAKYQAQFPADIYPQYQPGATFLYLPEHTWALGTTYARAKTTVALHLTGTGQAVNLNNDVFFQRLTTAIRLPQNRSSVTALGRYIPVVHGYTLADLVATARLSPRVEGLLQVQNLMDHYTNDWFASYATMGRQTKIGVRCLW